MYNDGVLSHAEATCGARTVRCALDGTCTRRREQSSFAAPIIPEADSAWPIFAFTLPISNAPACTRGSSSADAMAPASIGSPSAEPLAAASTRVSCSAVRDASLSTAPNSICCALPLGAVRLALRPSCRTAVAVTSSGAAAAADRSVLAPTPSPRTKPSARASNGHGLPDGDVSFAVA
eukprot:7391456-Prymnesium_polylepis.2